MCKPHFDGTSGNDDDDNEDGVCVCFNYRSNSVCVCVVTTEITDSAYVCVVTTEIIDSVCVCLDYRNNGDDRSALLNLQHGVTLRKPACAALCSRQGTTWTGYSNMAPPPPQAPALPTITPMAPLKVPCQPASFWLFSTDRQLRGAFITWIACRNMQCPSR